MTTVSLPKYRSTLRERRTADLKRRVVDQMIKIIAEDGLHQSAMAKLARRARVSQGSISWHFGSRSQLLLAVAIEILRRLTVPVSNDPSLTRVEKILALIDGYIEVARAQGDAMQAGVPLFSDVKLLRDHNAELADLAEAGRKNAVDLLRTAAAAGEIRPVPPLVFLAFLVSSMEGIHNRMKYYAPRDREAVFAELRRASLCVLGLCQSEGAK